MSADLVLRNQVETLYRGAAASRQEFPIPLEGEAPDGQLLWEWAHLSRANNARQSVTRKKQLIEGDHYLLLRSQQQVTSANGVTQTRETVTIWFSVEGFELWLLMLDTPRGHEIRQYFRECHKRLQLDMSQPTTMNQITDTLAELSHLVVGGFCGVKSEIQEVRRDVSQIRDEFQEFKSKQSYRKPAPVKNLRLYKELVQSAAYGNQCPCCDKEAASWEEDHWFDRSKNALTEMWLVCKPCNRKLGTGGSVERQEHVEKFYAFQHLLKRKTYQGSLDLAA